MENLEELIKAAENQIGYKIGFERDRFDQKWSVWADGPNEDDVYSSTYTEVIAKLKEWATPKPPKTVTITVPYRWALWHGTRDGAVSDDGVKVNEACREAIAPYQPK